MDHNYTSSSLFDPFDYPISFDDNEIFEQLLSDFPPSSQQLDPSTMDAEIHTKHEGPSQQNAAATVDEEGKPESNDKNKGKRKAVDIERRRRQEMSALNRSLRSFLPPEYIKGKRSTTDHLEEAVRYIKDLQERNKDLREKRDDLLKMRSPTGNSSSSHNSNQQFVTVKPFNRGLVEITVNTCAIFDDEKVNHQKLSLSKVLHVLSREGLSVMNCVSSRVDNNLIHSIQAQNGSDIELSLLQQHLTDYL